MLELNLKVGGGMEVRVTVRLGSMEGQPVQPPQGASKVATGLPSHLVTEVSRLHAQQLGNESAQLDLLSNNHSGVRALLLNLDCTGGLKSGIFSLSSLVFLAVLGV